MFRRKLILISFFILTLRTKFRVYLNKWGRKLHHVVPIAYICRGYKYMERL